jgi:flavin-dependent dehydrogenase
VLFDADLLPGYAWVFPLGDGTANVGLGVRRDARRGGREHRALWGELLSRGSFLDVLGHDAEPDGPTRAWPIPGAFRPESVAMGRVLFAGDAARAVDPMTGEGIAQALESGTIAATLVAAGASRTDTVARYRRAITRTIGRDVRFAAALRTLLQLRRGANAAVAVAGLTPWTRRNFARWLFEDYPRAMLLTPDRWRRGMFTGAGAYRAPAA